jgi:lipoate-protein ligase A
MEYDRQLLESFQEGDNPVLRFFFFDRPTLTLGRLEARRLKLEGLSFPYEIRPTGGRAVLHGPEDLCYAVVASKQDPLTGGDLIDSYCRIGHLLARGIQTLGRDVRMVEEKHTSLGDIHCFSAPSKAELTLNGKKVAGGAQARRGGVFLQQGVLLLSVSPEWKKAFPGASLEGMTGLNDPRDLSPITRERLEKGLIDSFERAGARFERP